jgi:hypothetical protein
MKERLHRLILSDAFKAFVLRHKSQIAVFMYK